MFPLKHGNIYQVLAFPPLDGGDPKRRPAVYLDLSDSVPPTNETYLFVGITTEPVNDNVDFDAIEIRHALPEISWLIPRWVREISSEQIDKHVDKIYGIQLTQLVEAVIDRFFDYPLD